MRIVTHVHLRPSDRDIEIAELVGADIDLWRDEASANRADVVEGINLDILQLRQVLVDADINIGD